MLGLNKILSINRFNYSIELNYIKTLHIKIYHLSLHQKSKLSIDRRNNVNSKIVDNFNVSLLTFHKIKIKDFPQKHQLIKFHQLKASKVFL